MTRPLLALAYHAVTGRWAHPLAVAPHRLREQLVRLKDRGLRATTFTELARNGAHGRVAITFDDGFGSVATNAKPILDELGWQATVFVVTGATDAQEPMRWLVAPGDAGTECLPLTWDQLDELAAAGWEVGSHGCTHRLLSSLSASERDDELTESRADLVARFGSCTAISYPWGEVKDEIVAAAHRAGYTSGSGLVGKFTFGDPMRVPRFAVGRSDGRLRFALKTSAAVATFRGTPAWPWLDELRRQSRPLGI